jgi:signal transduction histidine kinase
MQLFILMKSWLGERPVTRFVLAGLLVGLSLGLRLSLLPHIHGMPFLTFLPAMLAIIWFCGRWPSVFALCLSSVLAALFLFPDTNHLVFPWTSGTVGVVIFTIYGLALVLAIDGVLRALDLMRKAVAERDELLRRLEARMDERTAQLSSATANFEAETLARKAAEQRAAQLARLDAVGHLVSGVSHDFKNLLGIISGNIDMALRIGADGDARMIRHLTAARDGAVKAAALTQRLLGFARREPFQPECVDLNALVSNMVEMLGTTLGDHIVIDTDLTEEALICHVDAGQLENAIVNLAVNGRDAMPNGGRLCLQTRAVAESAVLSVTDTGVGMSEEVRAQALEPFFTTKPPGVGTGLGLSQIHGLVLQSGGALKITSKPGEGARIDLYFPLQPQHDVSGLISSGRSSA